MAQERKSISLVVPAYNEGNLIAAFCQAALEILLPLEIPFEIIFVDDGSKDHTWAEIERQSARDGRIKGLRFTRNFGKESAIAAGLAHAEGDACITIDCDLEHPPSLIPQMIDEWRSNEQIYVISGVKNDRAYLSLPYRVFSWAYYGVFKLFCRVDMKNQTDFKLIDRQVVDAYLALPERCLFYRGMISWFGFPTKEIHFDVNIGRRKSHWNTISLIKFAINTIASYTGSPLYIIAGLGAFFLLLALIFGVIALTQYINHIAVSGFTTTILLILIQGGLMLVSLSILGLYLMKVFDENKHRPLYAILKSANLRKK